MPLIPSLPSISQAHYTLYVIKLLNRWFAIADQLAKFIVTKSESAEKK